MAGLALTQLNAQQRPAQRERTFTSASEVAAMIEKAKNERKSDQSNFVLPLLKLAPYTANFEYRDEGVDSPATLHEAECEMIFVIEGAGVLTQGGKLLNETRSNATNLRGSGVEGGTAQRIAKGDYVFVPANTPHSFTKTEGTLVIMSLHLPKDVVAKDGATASK
jgi:mannose-6-phosphate isomerase-like protein (cupin superfamily)